MMVANKETYAEISRKIREAPLEEPCASYKWEELVQKLCASNDAKLHDIGVRELNILRDKCPGCPAFKIPNISPQSKAFFTEPSTKTNLCRRP
jgi:hypothetical protein